MTRILRAVLTALLFIAFAMPNAGATSRIKDLANIEGVRQNQLIGYGLVVGLNGTGDTLNNIPFTKQSLTAMLERLGVNVRGQTLRTGNVAAVMVTANLLPSAAEIKSSSPTLTFTTAMATVTRSPRALLRCSTLTSNWVTSK